MADENFLTILPQPQQVSVSLESLTVRSDLYGSVCHTTVASKSCCFNQSPCFIYLLVFLHVVMGLYCPQSTTMVPVKSDYLLTVFLQWAQRQTTKTSAAELLDRGLCCKKYTNNWQGESCKIHVGKMFHDTTHSNGKNVLHKHCFTVLVEKLFIDCPAIMPQKCVWVQCCSPTHVSDRPVFACPLETGKLINTQG